MSKTKKFRKSEKNDSRIVRCQQCNERMFADEAVFSVDGIFCSESCAIKFEEKR